MEPVESAAERSADQSATNRQRSLVVVSATIATLAIWIIADPILGYDLIAETGTGDSTQRVGPIAVILITAFAGLIGWALLALLEKVSARGRTIWIAVAVVLLAISFLGPTGGTTTSTKVVLACMHLAAGVILIPGLALSKRGRFDLA